MAERGGFDLEYQLLLQNIDILIIKNSYRNSLVSRCPLLFAGFQYHFPQFPQGLGISAVQEKWRLSAKKITAAPYLYEHFCNHNSNLKKLFSVNCPVATDVHGRQEFFGHSFPAELPHMVPAECAILCNPCFIAQQLNYSRCKCIRVPRLH